MTSAPEPPTDAPTWFTEALAAPREEHVVEVEGCPIHTFRWGERGRPGLVLVHGGAAHAQWWSFIAPHLARQYDVIVVDPYLTGGVLDGDGALLAMIRSRQPSAALIVLTGYGSSSLTISAERERAMAVLTKPQPVVLLSQLVVDASRNSAVGETMV